MTSRRRILVGLIAGVSTASWIAFAAQPPAPGTAGAAGHPMSFFVTSAGLGDGANLGGIAGADAHCQQLAAAVGRGAETWHAYLSTQGPHAVNARDRIGRGPWYDAKGELVARSVDDLHPTASRAGGPSLALDEHGRAIPGEGQQPNLHDVLTGSQPDGRAFADAADHTCQSWTSDHDGKAQMGHADRLDRESKGQPTSSWNSAHPSRSDCSQSGMQATGMGAALFYCFAVH
jgi:hypothetical protein